MSQVWELPIKKNLKFVLLALADYSNDEGKCYPGIETIAKKCSMSEQTVITMIKKLCEYGLLKKEVRYKKGKKTSNIYCINIELGTNSLGKESLGKEFVPNHLYMNHQLTNNNMRKCANSANSAHNHSCAFLKFYAEFPRKRDKTRAWNAWLKNNPNEKLNEKIFEGLKKYKFEIKLKKIEIDFVKYPASWLNGQCWEDEYVVEKAKLSNYVKCKKCGKQILRNCGSAWCEKCTLELFPPFIA